MSTSGFRLAPLSLAAALMLFLAPFTVVSGQVTNGQTRPRSLNNPSEEAVRSSEGLDSAEASVEAKKLYKTGVQYSQAGLHAQAVDLFERAVKLKPDFFDGHRSLGHAYIDLKQWEKAVGPLQQALVLNPKDKEARDLLDQAQAGVRLEPSAKPGSPNTPGITPAPPSEKEVLLTKIYKVGPGDVIEVRIGETAPTSHTVSSSGVLEHSELVGSVLGLTVEEISDKLEAAKNGSNTVSVEVRDYVSHTILVSGLIKEPGPKILRREAIPLYVVVADAQPLPEAERVTVVRNVSNEMFTIDLAEPTEMGLLVKPGDVITLQRNPTQFFYVSGDVKEPGEKVFRRGLTLTQAIITAGGLTAKPGEAQVARDNGSGFLVVTRYKLKEIEAGKLQDPLVQPGDRITIRK